MKVGDLVSYSYWENMDPKPTGLVLFINEPGGTVKVYSGGRIKWFVVTGCEVVSESWGSSKVGDANVLGCRCNSAG